MPILTGCATLRFQGNHASLRAEAGELTRQARAALTKGSSQLARRLLNRSLECCPNDPQAMALLAEAELKNGDSQHAISTLQAVAKHSPERIDLRVRLGRAWLESGHVLLARNEAEQVLQIQPEYSPAWQLMGDVHQIEGSFDNALAAYHRAAAGSEPQPGLQLQIADVYRRQGKLLQSLAAVERYQSRFRMDDPDYEALLLEGELLTRMGQNTRAIERLTLATGHSLATPESHVRLSHALVLDNRHAQARQTLERASHRWPETGELSELLAGMKQAAPAGSVAIR